MLTTTFRIAFLDMKHRPGIVLVMIFALTISLLVFLVTLLGQRSMVRQFNQVIPGQLVVAQENSFGEVFGSRIPVSVGERLNNLGLSQVVPEIRDIAGTSVKDATLVRGVPLASYRQVEEFELVAGRALVPGNPPRLAMIGTLLAELQNLAPGGVISLRGRDFTVTGIFHTRSYVDNEAWISLEDAQVLFGYGTDVSLFLVPDGEALREGDLLSSGISVARRGEGGKLIGGEIESLLSYLQMTAAAMSLATALSLASILWRLAWLRRRQFGILRALGFGGWSMLAYITSQAVVLVAVSLFLGFILANILGAIISKDYRSMGFSFTLGYDAPTVLAILGWAVVITLVSVGLPALGLNRENPAALLRRE